MTDPTILTMEDCQALHVTLTDLSKAVATKDANTAARLALSINTPHAAAYSLSLVVANVAAAMDPGAGVVGMETTSADAEDRDLADLMLCWMTTHDEAALIDAIVPVVRKGHEHSLKVLINALMVGTAFINGALNIGVVLVDHTAGMDPN